MSAKCGVHFHTQKIKKLKKFKNQTSKIKNRKIFSNKNKYIYFLKLTYTYIWFNNVKIVGSKVQFF
jgi:hypothetical protein